MPVYHYFDFVMAVPSFLAQFCFDETWAPPGLSIQAWPWFMVLMTWVFSKLPCYRTRRRYQLFNCLDIRWARLRASCWSSWSTRSFTGVVSSTFQWHTWSKKRQRYRLLWPWRVSKQRCSSLVANPLQSRWAKGIIYQPILRLWWKRGLALGHKPLLSSPKMAAKSSHSPL